MLVEGEQTLRMNLMSLLNWKKINLGKGLMEIRRITAGLILSTLTTFSWGDGHGHNLEDCVKKFAAAQVGNWEGNFRFWNQAVNQVVDVEFKNSITKIGEDKLKFAMTSATGSSTTEQPIASEWSGSPNWIKESSTTYKVTSCNVTDEGAFSEVVWQGTNAMSGDNIETTEQVTINIAAGTTVGSSRTKVLGNDAPAFIWGFNTATKTN